MWPFRRQTKPSAAQEEGSLVPEDPGLASVLNLYETMQLDPEWSVREDRGFTWWGLNLAQRVWSEQGFDDEGIVIYRVHAQTDVVRDVEVTDAILQKLNALNRLCTTSALIADAPGRSIRLVASMWVHAGTFTWASRFWALVVGTQAAQAHAQCELLSTLLGGSPAASAHPRSGNRQKPDDLLYLGDRLVIPAGGESSRWAGAEMKQLPQTLKKSVLVLDAAGTADKLALELAFRQGVAHVLVDAKAAHPAWGNGMFVRLKLPDCVDKATQTQWPNQMNQRELTSMTRAHFIGSWALENETPNFIAFFPNVAKLASGDILNLVLSTALRARWMAENVLTHDGAVAALSLAR